MRKETRVAPAQVMEAQGPHFRGDEHVFEPVPLAGARLVIRAFATNLQCQARQCWTKHVTPTRASAIVRRSRPSIEVLCAVPRMNSAWKMVQPKPKPRQYSSKRPTGRDRVKYEAIAAPARMPKPSPATQCMVEPRT
jgi:hypothetical protein